MAAARGELQLPCNTFSSRLAGGTTGPVATPAQVRSVAPRVGRRRRHRRRQTSRRGERRKRKFPYRKVEDIEADIARVEGEIADLEVDLASPKFCGTGSASEQVHQDYAAVQEELAELMQHWEEGMELN